GFRAASDADSEGEEGKFFVWTAAEVHAVLDEEHAGAVSAYYGITDPGTFHGTSIPHVVAPLAEIASRLGVEHDRLRALLDESRPRLYAARARRVPPHTDPKPLGGR